jgi:hypothetical protein
MQRTPQTQRTSHGSGSSCIKAASVRKILLERRHFVSETQSLSNRQAMANGDPAQSLASSRLNSF